MKANWDGTAPQAAEHEWASWGEYWRGTKEQLQALGIGVGLSFPGDDGVRAGSTIRTTDPRGIAVEVIFSHQAGRRIFFATSPYRPGERNRAKAVRRKSLAVAMDYGVTVYRDMWTHDEYVGSGQALAALGLVRPGELPGAPGMGRVMVSIDPSGARISQGCSGCRRPGSRIIFRRGCDRFAVEDWVSAEVSAARRDDDKRFTDEQDALDFAAARARQALDPGWQSRQRFEKALVGLAETLVRRAPVTRLTDRKMPAAWRVITNAAPVPAIGARVPALHCSGALLRLVRRVSEPATAT